MSTIKIINTGSYKTGLNEVQGLKQELAKVLKPVQKAIKDKVYWNDVEYTESNYLGCDGFIPYSHNCGGLELYVIVPKCEESNFDFLRFGEHDHDCNSETKGEECICGENDGHLDAKLRVWLKFEGIDSLGIMSFYLVLSGGNGDAPYFREKHSKTYFEREFECDSLEGIKLAAQSHINDLVKLIA